MPKTVYVITSKPIRENWCENKEIVSIWSEIEKAEHQLNVLRADPDGYRYNLDEHMIDGGMR